MKPNPNRTPHVTLGLRVSPGVHKLLVELAEARKESLNACAVRLLVDGLREAADLQPGPAE